MERTQSPHGILIIVGASGTGKTTLLQELLKLYSHASKIVTYTTRQPRENERHMRDYYFCSQEEYFSLRDKGFFAESEHVHGRLYGTPQNELHLSPHTLSLLCIDIQGAITLKQKNPHIRIIAVEPPSLVALETRLRKRAQDNESAIQTRMQTAAQEIRQARDSGIVDLFVINDDFTELFAIVREYIETEMIAK